MSSVNATVVIIKKKIRCGQVALCGKLTTDGQLGGQNGKTGMACELNPDIKPDGETRLENLRK